MEQTNLYSERIHELVISTANACVRYCPYLKTISVPENLESLDLEGSGIERLPELPETLDYLNISKTNIKTMPNIKNVRFLLADDLRFANRNTPIRLPWESGYQYAERMRRWQIAHQETS